MRRGLLGVSLLLGATMVAEGGVVVLNTSSKEAHYSSAGVDRTARYAGHLVVSVSQSEAGYALDGTGSFVGIDSRARTYRSCPFSLSQLCDYADRSVLTASLGDGTYFAVVARIARGTVLSAECHQVNTGGDVLDIVTITATRNAALTKRLADAGVGEVGAAQDFLTAALDARGYTGTVGPAPTGGAQVRFQFDMGNPNLHEDFTLTLKTGDTGSVGTSTGSTRVWYYTVVRWVSASNHHIVFRMSEPSGDDVVWFQNGDSGFSGFAGSYTTYYGYLLVVP